MTVATVRPVTLLGDTAVAVNPADERYSDLIGQRAIVPLVEREVPIVGDEHVDPAVGTGALKVTPGHDPNDLEIARRHGLEEIAVIGFDGRMTAAAGERYAGLTSEEAARARRRRPARARPAARRAALAAQRRALLALGQPRRAARLAAVVLRDGGAGRARDRRRARGPRALHPQEPRAHLLRLDGADPALVRLAPALVGAPAAGLVLQLRRDDRAGRAADAARPAARASSSAIPTCSTPGSPRRCGRSRRSAGPTRRRAARVLSRARAVHGARHHQPLGRAHGDDGHRLHRATSRSGTSSSTRPCSRPTAGACRSRSARASIRST